MKLALVAISAFVSIAILCTLAWAIGLLWRAAGG